MKLNPHRASTKTNFLSRIPTGYPIVSSVASQSTIIVNLGTSFSSIPFPANVSISLSNGSVLSVPVTWVQGSYNSTIAADYLIYGTLNTSVSNPNNIRASVIVTVQINSIIGLANLQNYYQASLQTANNGDKVNWIDQSGNGNDTSQPSTLYRSTYTTNFLNGKAVFGHVDVGQDQYFAAVGTQYMHKGVSTVYMLIYITVAGKAIYDSNSGNLGHIGRTIRHINSGGNGSFEDLLTNASGTAVIDCKADDNKTPIGQWNLIVLKNTGGVLDSNEISVNSLLVGVRDLDVTNQAYSLSSSTDTPFWCTNQSGSSVFRGYIASIAIFNVSHDDVTEKAITGYYNNYYNLGIHDKPLFSATGRIVSTVDTTTILTGSGTYKYVSFPTGKINPLAVKISFWLQYGSTHNAAPDQYGVYFTYEGNNVLSGPTTIRPAGADAWNSSRPYLTYELVDFGGKSWKALRNNTNVSPVEGSDWTSFTFLWSGFCGGFDHLGRMYVTFVAIPTGADSAKLPGRTPYIIYSDVQNPGPNDFSTPKIITTDFPLGMAMSACPIFEYNSEMYVVFYANNGAGSREGVIYKSSDRGVTWTQVSIFYPQYNADGEEPNIMRRSDGLFISYTRFDPTETTTFGKSARGSRMQYSFDLINWSTFFSYFQSQSQNPIVFFPDGNMASIGRTLVGADPTGHPELNISTHGGKLVSSTTIDPTFGFGYAGGDYYPPENKIIYMFVIDNLNGTTTVKLTRLKSE